MTATVDGLWVDNAASVFVARLGEAGYYNMAGTPTERMKAHIDLHNINGKNIASTGIAMLGSESLLNGYLARDIKALGAKDRVRAQTDKITFNLDGFYLADSGIVVNAPYVRIANGTQKDGGKRGIWLQSEAAHFEIDNVKVLDNDGIGIASDRRRPDPRSRPIQKRLDPQLLHRWQRGGRRPRRRHRAQPGGRGAY